MVHGLNVGAAAGGDSAFAGAVDHVREVSLLRRHGVDDGVHAAILAVVHALAHGLGDVAHAGQLFEHAVHPAHGEHLLQLLLEIHQVEFAAALHLAHQAVGLALVDLAFRFFDQRQHVAHAEDARGDAIWMERLQRVGPLAGAQELDGFAGDGPHGERCTATRIAVHLGEHHARQRQRVVERLGGVGGVLAGHGVHHEQRLDGVQGVVKSGDLGHHLFVDG